MISDRAAMVFLFSIAVMAAVVGWSVRRFKHRYLLHRLYLLLVALYTVWAVIMLGMWITPPDRIDILFALDCFSYLGTCIPPVYLMICLVFVRSYEHLPRWCYLFLVIPVVSVLICLTNPLHHLQYQVFSVVRSELIFGPYVFVTGAHSYVCFISSFVLLINFAVKNPSKLYLKQCAMLVLGGICPMLVSLVATFSGLEVPITATPLGFMPMVLFNGIAIYRFNLLDITPIATQHVLDWVSDCYLTLSNEGLVISYNKSFAANFANQFGISENKYLKDCVKEEDISNKTALYNMISAVDACREAQTTISYEQSAMVTRNDIPQKFYYVADVSILNLNNRSVGFVVLFKDITQLKKSMQQLQESEKRMMERERFAFLGQMIGGLAHNLKTPIMSISGCVSAAEDLIEECESSLADPQVNDDDYREIYGEIKVWFQKIRESSAYMSDIITAIKGQATNVSTNNDSTFTLDELIKRTALLMRHELFSDNCILVEEGNASRALTLRGDINNLVQVLANLVSNAIYAQKQVGGGKITLGMEEENRQLRLYVKDTGPGVPEQVKKNLFKEMITSKGAMGSGLGLYISNAVVQGKFGGTMWCEDNPEGGAVFGITVPLDAYWDLEKEEEG